jgi:hypothetical protein
MRVNYLIILPGLGLLTVAEASSAQGPRLFHRDVIDPDETTGSGETCADAFGLGYTECGTGTSGKPYCYDPSFEVCCGSTGAACKCRFS